MKTLYVVAAIAVTILCWGIYGPVIHTGQQAFADAGGEATLGKIQWDDSMRSFICVGVAYFVIAIVVPVVVLRMAGEPGHWSAGGTFWSLVAGAGGAIGALGVIAAFRLHGNPVFVMPLIFGGAPVINSFLTIYWTKTFRQIGPVFIAGLIMVILGAMTVLMTKPSHGDGGLIGDGADFMSFIFLLLAIVVVVLCWGAYGPVLHKGQMQMAGSRLRPLICVGLAYFGIAVVGPLVGYAMWQDDGTFASFGGIVYSLFGGVAGAMGALGVIYAFNWGGKPIFVMPLIFGGAPVVNTIVSMAKAGQSPSPIFFAGLIIVAAGAIVVLIFAPKGHAPAKPAAAGPLPPTEPEPRQDETKV